MPSVKILGGQYKLDARPDRLDLRDRIYRPPLVPIAPESPTPQQIKDYLPLYEDLVLNQGSEGACTGFGLAAVINFQFWFRDVFILKVPPPTGPEASKRLVSVRMLYQLAKLYDEWDGEDYEGSSCRGAMRGWHHHGVCTEHHWPYREKGKVKFLRPKPGWDEDATKRPLGAYYRIETKSIPDMQAAVQEVHAIYASAEIHSGWDLKPQKSALPTIKHGPSAQPWGGHAFAIVGYNARGFIVQNSWGKTWGFKGFALLPYSDWLAHGMDAWAAVRGAAIDIKAAPVSFTRESLQRQDPSSKPRVAKSGAAPGALPKWSESEAYNHSIVLGNQGRPIARLLSAQNGADHIKITAEENVRAWCQASGKNRKLLIYAHGGLNEEEASVNRIAVLGPYFKANGVYPLFITWKSGLLESLGNMFKDAFAAEPARVPTRRAGGIADFFDDVAERIADANDYTWEEIARRVAVKSIWTEMKENAMAASDKKGGNFLLAEHMKGLRQEFGNLEIHLIGHSAGAVVFGKLVEKFRKDKTKLNSMTLYAPACTMQYAADSFGPSFKDGTLKKSKTTIDLLSDDNERDDQVAKVYRKSLLYLVSRALEPTHKTPILGLAAAWDPAGSKHKPDTFPKDEENSEIKAWLGVWGNGPKPVIESKTEVPDSTNTTIKASHGSFDNNIRVMTRSLEAILGKKLKVPITDLRGF